MTPSGVEGQEQEGGEDREMDAAFLEGGPAGEDGEPAHHHGEGQQDHLGRAEAEDQRPLQPDGGDGDRRDGSPILAMAEPKARLKLVCTRSRRALRTAASVLRFIRNVPFSAYGVSSASSASIRLSPLVNPSALPEGTTGMAPLVRYVSSPRGRFTPSPVRKLLPSAAAKASSR